MTPLHCASRSGHEGAVDLLLERGAQVLAKTKNGLGPLHMAVQGDHVSCCRLLLYHKAPIDDVTVVRLLPSVYTDRKFVDKTECRVTRKA